MSGLNQATPFGNFFRWPGHGNANLEFIREGKMRNRFIAASCVALMLASTTVSARTPQEMLDALKNSDIFHAGSGATPSGNVTRQELAIILAKAMNIDVGSNVPSSATFSDVPASAYSSSYIDAAIKAGQIISSSDVFQAPMTHEQLKTAMVQAFDKKLPDAPDTRKNDADWATAYIKASAETTLGQSALNGEQKGIEPLTMQAATEHNQANENTIQNSVQKTANAAGGGDTSGWASQPHPGWDDFSYFGNGLLSASAPPVQGGAYTYNGRMAGAFADGGTFGGGTLILNFNLSSASIDGSLELPHGIAPVTGGWSGNHINATFNGSDVQLGAVNGNLKGGFYGPHQEQIGGTWSMTAGSRAASGQFAGSR
jgi:hypothetical protein